ncbi:MAG TPA: hypothetical protein VN867_12645 [Candidatus Binataceae bacterium]|nr:hypothetical protein [Candidatus Binataceae bacterium]
MDDKVRGATKNDLPRMIELADQKRIEYEKYQPTFWRRANHARVMQTALFEKLLQRENVIALVHDSNAIVDGFVIATITPAPPVYDPGGATCLIDDFTVTENDLWQTAGRALLREAIRIAKERGAVQTVVVCGHLDEAKRAFLRSESLTIASEWYVKNI